MLPMLSTIGKPFSSPDWIYEIKWDGFRCLSIFQDNRIQLKSKKGNSLTSRFKSLIKNIALPFDCILDGEVIVPDHKGYCCFDSLIKKDREQDLVYVVFDLLSLDGKTLIKKPLLERKELLKTILPVGTSIRFCDHLEDQGEAFFKLTVEHGLEGIVAKKKDSVYLPGERVKGWLKIKNKNYSLGARNHYFNNRLRHS
jgi:bifunctional non-homologous end joining protein LigD